MTAQEARARAAKLSKDEIKELHIAILRKVSRGEMSLLVNKLTEGAKASLEDDGYKVVRSLGSTDGYIISW